MNISITPDGKNFKVLRDFDGVVNAVFEHEISKTKATMNYVGPCITPETWYAITSFFQWTYDTTKSESQVRLFLHPQKKLWLAWAFPQEAKTGMSARELDNEDKKKQRAALPDAAELLFFGTVHHHCSCSAFQSGTDRNGTDRNDGEKDQDGLHITIGNMDKDPHDIHARFYLNKQEFVPNLALFWDVGELVKRQVPSSLWDTVARFQMCQKINAPFPEEWRANLIEIKSSYNREWTPGSQYNGGLGYSSGATTLTEEPEYVRIEDACSEAIEKCFSNGFDGESINTVVEFLWKDKIVEAIVDAASALKVEFESVVRELALSLEDYLDVTEVDPKTKKPQKESKRAKRKREKEEKLARERNGPWEVEFMPVLGSEASYFRAANKTQFGPTRHATREAAQRECDFRNGVQRPVNPTFKPTHKIQDRMVMWDTTKMHYLTEDGSWYDFDEKIWIDAHGKPIVGSGPKAGQINVIVASKLLDTELDKHWDEQQKRWVDEAGAEAYNAD
jgi:hypothetical protein